LGVCRPYHVYHVTVMPCYDKKLEAVRDDFTFSVDGKEVTEVDSVLTTGEVLDLIQVATWFFFLLVVCGFEKQGRHLL
jgi:iron only hydrogenase large subunit-like protein